MRPVKNLYRKFCAFESRSRFIINGVGRLSTEKLLVIYTNMTNEASAGKIGGNTAANNGDADIMTKTIRIL